MGFGSPLKPATGRPCVPTLGDSGTVPAITCDCFRVAELLMRRRYFDLCVTASSRTMLTFENNVSCSSRDCSTKANIYKPGILELSQLQLSILKRCAKFRS